jgi:hypothetical protein
MDHLDAAQMKAVERYMLGDLSVSEVEEFERHFFDCPQCSEELRALTIFQENARAVFIEQDAAPIPVSVHVPESAVSWWRGFSPLSFIPRRSWALALCSVLIGVVVGYVPAARQTVQYVPQNPPFYSEARAESKHQVVKASKESRDFYVYLDRSWERPYQTYLAVLHGSDTPDVPALARFRARLYQTLGWNKVKFHLDEKDSTIGLTVPTHAVPAGRPCELVIYGIDEAGKETEVARSLFTLQLQ